MRTFRELVTGASDWAGELTLPYDLRCKSRLRATLDTGEAVALLLPRGTVLRDGTLLRAEDGTVIRVKSAAEPVSTARASNHRAFALACYHLGNRHVALQIGGNWLRFLHDHVLEELAAGLGLEIVREQAAFEPESGAYSAGHGHSHGHRHDEDGGPAGLKARNPVPAP